MKLSLTDKFLWDLYVVLEKTGDITAFILNPHSSKWNSLWQLNNPVFEKYKHDKNRAKFSKLIYYLKRNNYIKVASLNNVRGVVLTKEGFGKILKASFKIEKKNKRKDGKWVMLIFDIPQKYKKSRELLRGVLHNLGYKLLQQSVWVTPYDVSEKTEKLLQFYSLDNFVKLFLIEEM